MRTPTSALLIATMAATLLLAGCTSTRTVPIEPPGSFAPSTPAAAPTTPAATASRASWLAAGGADALRNLTTEARTVNADARKSLTSDDLINDCMLLDSGQSGAAALPAIPVPAAQQHWAAALASIKNGTFHCIHGASSSDQAEAQGGNASIAAALRDLQAVQKQLGAR